MEMKEEVLSSEGAQNMDTSGYPVSDLDDIDFYWENDQLEIDAVLRPKNDIPFSPTALGGLEMRGSAENPILVNEEEDNGNSPPTIPVSETPIQTPALLRSQPFEQRSKIFQIMFFEICLKNKIYIFDKKL